MINASVFSKLLTPKYTAETIPPIDGPGLYALFLEHGEMPGVIIKPSRILYVGMTESSLSIRNHFAHKHSGFSSLRRTLGALLKSHLLLRPRPRGVGPSARNFTNFRFQDEGEERLTTWMTDHLTYGFAVVEREIHAMESALIAELQPPLNLTGWLNPYRSSLKELRRLCREEAKACELDKQGYQGADTLDVED